MRIWRRGVGVVPFLALFLALIGPVNAWVKSYQPFPDGEATVVMHRFCRGTSCGPFTDQDWQTMIRAALTEWNEAGANFIFRERQSTGTEDPCNLPVPGLVAVILANPVSLCRGDGPLGDGGRTEYGRRQVRVYINADSSYAQDREEIRRLLLHEFGHVVGLGHPDEHGLYVQAIMNSHLGTRVQGQWTPFYHLQSDDIVGIRALYGTRAAAGTASALESPAPGATVSGLGFLSGWKCEAQDITIRIDGGAPLAVAMNIPRADTRESCGGRESNNGFIIQTNWNWLSQGTHTAVAYDNGVEFARSTFTVGTTGEEFLEGVAVSVEVPDFPAPGETGRFVWNESTQHLELAEVLSAPEPEPPTPQDDLEPLRGFWLLGTPLGPYELHISRIHPGVSAQGTARPIELTSDEEQTLLLIQPLSSAKFPDLATSGHRYIAMWSSRQACTLYVFSFAESNHNQLWGTYWRDQNAPPNTLPCRWSGSGRYAGAFRRG